ncbi:DUF6134 family protein [Algoriphagus halophilus]|uniref:Uncharacterized protein n=1 Tax=Algoriphagus halophilus TaxID=226505 RepID=A0A1N6DWW4_9BACT|nr:DUF6134 family protein [Algoriphagus halophilus]SIN75288.1 hypothetical protein SAMN05444394_1487 [Algoriphagus halophilus]
MPFNLTFSKAYISLLLFLFLSSSVWGQESTISQNYDIVVAGFRIGGMTAQKIESPNETKFEINSLVDFWFFGRVHVDFLQKADYIDGQLHNASTVSNSNRGNFQTNVSWNNDHYVVDANTYKYENKEPVNQPIYSSPARLYFEEPNDGDILLSENFGLITTVVEDEPGVYSLEVNGNTNTFYYEDGILQKVVLENSIKNYVIRRSDD